MAFSSLSFLLIFLPMVLVVNLALRKIWLQNIFLLLASLFFYAWGEGILVLIMLFSILSNYLFGLAIDRATAVRRQQIFWLSIMANLGLLFVFKYANFFVENLNYLLPALGLSTVTWEAIQLPIGISFFSFQAMSYLIDLYYRKHPVQRNPFHLALYIALFPQLIAGPIVRYIDVYAQIKQRSQSLEQYASGLRRFMIGLAKKVLIADSLGLMTDIIFALPADEWTVALAWLGMLCYSLQIYFDFSGYSDMAIGLGRVLGFKFIENFNYPYIAQSIQDFWRRWHISLSTWFRDYLYFPLGGNRKGLGRTYFNLVIVFLLCGIWHGASWNFVVWGLFHGCFLVIERAGFKNFLARLPMLLRRFYTLFTVMIAWVFFRAADLAEALAYLKAMFGMQELTTNQNYWNLYVDGELYFTLALGLILSTPIYLKVQTYVAKKEQASSYRIVENLFLALLFGITVATLMGGAYNPFIYFRF
ncbi:MAG: MBOAT family protein [Saprospiraceae bacterium]